MRLLEKFFWCNLRSRNFLIPEIGKVFNFDSQQQKVDRLYPFTGTIHHVIVSADLPVGYINPFWADFPNPEKPGD